VFHADPESVKRNLEAKLDANEGVDEQERIETKKFIEKVQLV